MAKQILTPGLIDSLSGVRICDPMTLGLQIQAWPTGRKIWKFRRRLPGTNTAIRMSLGLFPTYSIADAREWADKINAQIEAGMDPREVLREEELLSIMTVDRA